MMVPSTLFPSLPNETMFREFNLGSLLYPGIIIVVVCLQKRNPQIYQSCQSCQELLQAKVTAPPLVA